MRFANFILALLARFGVFPSHAASDSTPPTIVVFIADDHGQLESEPYGAQDVRTPSMRRLAERGLTFTHAFVASPSCAPSRAALLTGLYPARNGAEANHTKPRPEIKKLPAYLRDAGYEVAGFGKVAHYNHDPEYAFDHYDKSNAVEKVSAYLARRDSTKPLCLFVGAHAPHVPWTTNATYDPAAVQLPPTHIDTPQTREFRARYYSDITRADRELGDIYDLAQKNFLTNLVFIYTSDHGAQWPFGKWNLYDAGIRVPLIVSWPGVIKPATKTDAMVSWIDLLPTLSEIAGKKITDPIDGRSFLPVLRDPAQKHRDQIFSTHSGDGRMNVYPMRSLRTADWKYILNLHPEYAYTTHIDLAKDRDGLKYWTTWLHAAKTNEPSRNIVTRYRQRPAEELYNLRADPHETNNLATDPAHAARLKSLRTDLEKIMNQQSDPRQTFAEPRLLP